METLRDTCGRGRVKPLLLIFLLVARTAADCPKPVGRENLVLTVKALLMNDFPEGVAVTLECANGHVKESGSGIINCTGGTWTEPDLVCKKIDCGPPPEQPNMSFNTSSGTLLGASIRVICNKGYKVSGASYKQCYPAGWSGRSRCNIVTCAAPGSVDNGRSTWQSQALPKYGEVIQYICKDGYILVGQNYIMCTESGGYDSEPPRCEGLTTEDLITKTPTSSPPPQEASTTGLSATATAHRDKTIMTRRTPAASPSPRGFALPDGDRATTASSLQTSTSFEDQNKVAVDTNKDAGKVAVIASIVGSIVAGIIGGFLYKYRLRKKGSSANGIRPTY